MEKEKLKLTAEQGRAIIYEDQDEFEIVYDKMIDNSRWSIEYEIVIKRISDGKFFKDFYRKAATENQDERPYEYCDPNFTEVFPIQKLVTFYE